MRFVRIFLLILIIIGTILIATQKYWVPSLVDKIISNDKKFNIVQISQQTNKKAPATYPPQIPPPASSTKIHVLVDRTSVLSGTTTAPGIPPSKYGIKIKVEANREESGTAIFGDAYLNGKEIARGVPVESTLEGTSPDLTYYAYRSRSHASCCSSFIGIEIFNQNTGEYTSIKMPPGENDSMYVSDSSSISWYDILSYIESYAWKDTHSINFVFYYFAWGTGERVSPREIWNYDLVTKQYTLISSE